MKLFIDHLDYTSIGVYCIENKINNKKYIGSTTNSFYKRWQAYKNSYIQGINRKFRNSIEKYGKDNFTFYIIETVEKSQVREREEYYIKLFNTVENGYNVRYEGTGGNGGANMGKKYPKPDRHIVEQRARKCSETRKGCKFSDDHCRAISTSKKGCKPSHSLNVVLYDTVDCCILRFDSATEAAKKLGCSIQQVCSLVKGNSLKLKRRFIRH